MSRTRRHGRGGLLIRHPFNYGRLCLRDDLTGGSIMNRARNYASRRRCPDRKVGRCLETLERNKTDVKSIMEMRGESGGVCAKMKEVRVWHAKQRVLCGGDDLGTKRGFTTCTCCAMTLLLSLGEARMVGGRQWC
jgi:hypothetical protein